MPTASTGLRRAMENRMTRHLAQTHMAGLAALASLLAVAQGVGLMSAASQEPERKTTVVLVLDYGDGVEKHYTALAWKPEMTALDALLAARDHPRGIKVDYRGSGASAFVTQIDDLKNEGRDRNWIYFVNGKLADRSCGAFVLAAGDRVAWRFGKYQPSP